MKSIRRKVLDFVFPILDNVTIWIVEFTVSVRIVLFDFLIKWYDYED